jgi:hypothetical protein
MMNKGFTPREELISNFAARCPSAAESKVIIKECCVCGHLDWASSQKANPPSVIVEPMYAGQCPECNTVAARAPEVFRWVVGVLMKHEGDSHDCGKAPDCGKVEG